MQPPRRPPRPTPRETREPWPHEEPTTPHPHPHHRRRTISSQDLSEAVDRIERAHERDRPPAPAPIISTSPPTWKWIERRVGAFVVGVSSNLLREGLRAGFWIAVAYAWHKATHCAGP